MVDLEEGKVEFKEDKSETWGRNGCNLRKEKLKFGEEKSTCRMWGRKKDAILGK